MKSIFFSYALVLTEFLGSGGIYKKILRFDVSRGLRSQKTPFLSHFTREFGQKLRAIALGGATTPKSKISSQIIYKCTKPLIPSVKFRGHRTFFPCNKSRLKWRNWDQLLTEYQDCDESSKWLFFSVSVLRAVSISGASQNVSSL